MLFRPSFCAHCGEKIERIDWGIFTSRRFCPVCESEFKGQDLIPRVIVGVGIGAGILGLGAYLRSDVHQATLVRPMAQQLVNRSTNSGPERSASEREPSNGNYDRPASHVAQNVNATPRTSPGAVRIESEGQLYHCGARTRKGTACSRKVKGNVRCFQHTGLPAMLPANELKVK